VPFPGYATGVVTRSVSAADTDYFVVNTQVGREYRARLSIWTAGPLKLQIYLYNGSRGLLDTSSSSSSYATLTWMADQATHYIQIEALNPNTTTLQTANYQLNIDEFAVTSTPTEQGADEYEPNNNRESAYQLPIAASASATDANFYPLPDEDWYKFRVQKGNTYRASTSNLINVDTRVEIFDRSGNRVANDNNGGEGFASEAEWEASYSNDYYYIKVTNLIEDSVPDDTYDLTVSEVTVATSTPKPTTAGPTPIPGAD